MKRITSIVSLRISALALAGLALLAGCSGGAPTVETPVTTGPVAAAAYNGPPPATADVQAFKINLWDNLQGDDKCGACHKPSQSPRFVRADDINLAYQEANTVVDLANPGLSRMVAKVRGGHHCWLADNNACGDTLTTWISNWASVTGGGGGKTITLIEPVDKSAGASRQFPTDPTAFSTTVYPLLTQYCSRCHQASAATAQQPFFATKPASNSAQDIKDALDTAYAAAQTKINLDDPSQSRFVLRLRNEFHNCWAFSGTVDCAKSAQAMEDAINQMITTGNIQANPIDPSLVISKALTLYDGTVASGGTRYDNNAIAVYEFKTGSGATAYDTSGVQPSVDLTLATTAKGGYNWVGGWGVQFTGGKAQGLTSTSKKFSDLIGQTGEFSIEVWAAPANVTQTEARIVSYSGGDTTRNFELGQAVYNYEFYNHTTASNANGAPALATADAAKVAQTSLQHVVVTYDPVKGRRIYVNAVQVAADPAGAALASWDDTFAFVLGNEVSGAKPWLGTIKFAAVHNRALTLPQIQQNFAAGVGERYFLLFNVSSIVNLAKSYIMFEVSQYDSYSYLFKDPKFISLDPTVKPGNLVLKGMRLGENGTEVIVGQAYSTLDLTITDSMYTSVAGASLSSVGTIITLQKGPQGDEFFLDFDQLGTQTHVHTEPAVATPAIPADGVRPSDIGVRRFDEINETFSQITGVSKNAAGPNATFANVRASLPAVADLTAFLYSHQINIAQLAVSYCSAMVDDSNLRTAFFGSGINAALASNLTAQSDLDAVINPIVAKVAGTNLTTQAATQLKAELQTLITNTNTSGPTGRALGLCAGSNSCGGTRTATAVKAACGSALGSAVMLVN